MATSKRTRRWRLTCNSLSRAARCRLPVETTSLAAWILCASCSRPTRATATTARDLTSSVCEVDSGMQDKALRYLGAKADANCGLLLPGAMFAETCPPLNQKEE